MSRSGKKGFPVLALAVGAWWTGSMATAQSPQEPPRKKGFFALVDKLSGKPSAEGGTDSKDASGNASTYTTLSGKTYQIRNFKRVTAEQGKGYREAMDQKNGFRTYRFGMTPEEFAKAAKEAGESFRTSINAVLSGPETFTLEPNGQAIVNQIAVEIRYGFYKNRLARIEINASDSFVTKGKAAQLYRTIAESFGPGLVLSDNRGPIPVYGGVVWASDKMEVLFGSTYDPSQSQPRKDDPLAATARDDGGYARITFESKEVLRPYYEQVAKKAKAGI